MTTTTTHLRRLWEAALTIRETKEEPHCHHHHHHHH
jgi:hypothetical protein